MPGRMPPTSQPGVVVEDRARHLAEKTKRRIVPIAERFGGFLRIGPDETGVAVRQVHRKKVDLAFDPRDLCQSLAKIHLRMTGIVLQRHKHLALLQTSPPNVVPDYGDPARVAVLVAKPLKDPLRGMPLLSRPPLIRRQDPVDDPGKRVQLRARRRPPPPIAGGHRERQHLGYRPRVNPKTSRRFPLAHTFNLNRKTNPSVQLHALHPPAPAAFRQRPSAAGFLFRRYRTARSLQ